MEADERDSSDIDEAHDAVPLATLRHGGIFGAEGALLGVPSFYAARVVGCERGAHIVVIGGSGLSRLRTNQPALHQKLLAAATQQQQDVTALLARRTALSARGGPSARELPEGGRLTLTVRTLSPIRP